MTARWISSCLRWFTLLVGYFHGVNSLTVITRQTFSASALIGSTISSPTQVENGDTISLLPGTANTLIPRIGYSLYKTPIDQVAEGVRLALDAGVRHFDVASLYGTTAEAIPILAQQPFSIQHKIANNEQSTSLRKVKASVLRQLRALPPSRTSTTVLLHSPLTDRQRRTTSYAALAELQAEGKIDGIGVAHFGCCALDELVVTANLPVPQLIQLELSPFQQHRDIIAWAQNKGSVVQCAAWSKLSSVQGPQEGWAKLGTVATAHACTKQQVLIRWAVQKGYACVPRSNSKYKVERAAIQENSWESTRGIVLTDSEMSLLDKLDEQILAGRLGLLDGWAESDIVGDEWDPTLFV